MTNHPHTVLEPNAASVPSVLKALAEDANAIAPMSAGRRYYGDGFVLRIGLAPEPPYNVVCRVRLTPDRLDEAIVEVRRQLSPMGHRASWEVGTSSAPGDLAERLLSRGFVPDEDEPAAVAMVLISSPADVPGDIVVRRARSAREFAAAGEVASQVWAGSPPWTEERRAEAIARWSKTPPPPESNATYVAWLGDTPIASGKAQFCEAGVFMAATGTLPEYRGRGAYRALVAARWRDAVEHGTPGLATAAGHMSQPILSRLGFIKVAELRFFNDAAADVAPPFDEFQAGVTAP